MVPRVLVVPKVLVAPNNNNGSIGSSGSYGYYVSSVSNGLSVCNVAYATYHDSSIIFSPFKPRPRISYF